MFNFNYRKHTHVRKMAPVWLSRCQKWPLPPRPSAPKGQFDPLMFLILFSFFPQKSFLWVKPTNRYHFENKDHPPFQPTTFVSLQHRTVGHPCEVSVRHERRAISEEVVGKVAWEGCACPCPCLPCPACPDLSDCLCSCLFCGTTRIAQHGKVTRMQTSLALTKRRPNEPQRAHDSAWNRYGMKPRQRLRRRLLVWRWRGPLSAWNENDSLQRQWLLALRPQKATIEGNESISEKTRLVSRPKGMQRSSVTV